MDSPRLIISTSSADAFRNKPIAEMPPPIENIELKQMGDASEGPHHHTVEISVGRKKTYTAKILISVCLVTLIAGGAIITSVRDWAYIGSDEENMFDKNWGASVSVDSWGDEETTGSGYGMDLTNNVGALYGILHTFPTCAVMRSIP